MKDKKLLADKIPSQGGRQIGEYLREYSKKMPKECSAVEIGTWLGAGTAQIALGILESRSNNPIFCYDYFRANRFEVKKAEIFDIELTEGQDTLPLVKSFLDPIYQNIIYNKGNIKDIKYLGPPIGLYVDDASKTIEKFLPVISEIEKHLIDGAAIVLMDYFFFEKRGNLLHKAQFDWVQNNSERFQFIKRINSKSSPAIFRYKKG